MKQVLDEKKAKFQNKFSFKKVKQMVSMMSRIKVAQKRVIDKSKFKLN